jgi:hypothetical protein
MERGARAREYTDTDHMGVHRGFLHRQYRASARIVGRPYRDVSTDHPRESFGDGVTDGFPVYDVQV